MSPSFNSVSRFKTLAIAAMAILSLAASGCGSSKDDQVEGVHSSVEVDYGPLTITAADFAAAARHDLSIELDRKPWSAWWNPMSDNHMYNGDNSPLGKYDAYAASKGIKSTAADEESRTRGIFLGSPWAGHCHAWAYASLLIDEPTRDRKLNGITFTVGDQKALLEKLFWHVDGLKTYGTKNTGRGEDFKDIYPDQFQRIIQAELFEKHRGFVIDRDAGEPVWNYPIFAADLTYDRDADNSTVHVSLMVKWSETQLYKVGSNSQDPDYEYRGYKPIAYFYYYDLKGRYDDAGNFHVRSGDWTGQSVSDHPDFVTVMPDTTKEKVSPWSNNDQIRNDLVLEIVGKSL